MEQEHKGLLEDLILEMMEVNQSIVAIDKKVDLSNNYLNNVDANSWATFEQLHIIAQIMSDSYKLQTQAMLDQDIANRKLLDSLETSRRAQAEADYEARNKKTPAPSAAKETKPPKELDFKFGSYKGFLGGLVIGFYKQIWQITKGVSRMFSHIGEWTGKARKLIVGLLPEISKENKLVKGISRIAEIIGNFWKTVSAPFKYIGSVVGAYFKDVWQFAKDVGKILGFIGKNVLKFVNMITGFSDVIKEFRVVFDEIRTGFTTVVNKVRKFFGVAGKAGFLGSLGKLFGRLLGVFGWVMTIFDTVMGAIDGFKKEGILGGIKGAIKGFFKIWTDLGDMILGAVAWVARLFGADDFAKKLQGFSFTALLSNTLDAVFNWFKLIFKDPGEALSVLWNNLVGEGGFMDMLWTPINKLIDWVTKKLGWRDDNAPEFSIGNVLRNIWNGMLEAIASWMQDVPILGKWAKDIRAMKAGTATANIVEMAKPTPEKKVSETGDTLKQAATDKRNTETAAETVRDIGAISAANSSNSTSSGPSNVNANTSVSTVNISQGSLPDRTDWSVMSGSFGLAP